MFQFQLSFCKRAGFRGKGPSVRSLDRVSVSHVHQKLDKLTCYINGHLQYLPCGDDWLLGTLGRSQVLSINHCHDQQREFPHFLQSWGQSPPPVTHLLTNWAWQLGWRLGHVSTAFLDLVFRVPTAKTCSLSWWESSESTSGVTGGGLDLVMTAAKSLAWCPS